MSKEPIYNYFELKHIDDGTTVTCTFQAMFSNEIIDNFITFMRGCGHSDKAMYEYMATISEEYFEMESKRIKELQSVKADDDLDDFHVV